MKKLIAGLVITGVLLCSTPILAEETDHIQYIRDQIEELIPRYEQAVEQAKLWIENVKGIRAQIMILQVLLKEFGEIESGKEEEAPKEKEKE